MVHHQFKTRDVFDCDLVRQLVELFDEQLHGIDLLFGLLGGPLCDRLCYRSVIITITIIEQLFVIAEENIANDRVNNVS
jgi:hypothetical protein